MGPVLVSRIKIIQKTEGQLSSDGVSGDWIDKRPAYILNNSPPHLLWEGVKESLQSATKDQNEQVESSVHTLPHVGIPTLILFDITKKTVAMEKRKRKAKSQSRMVKNKDTNLKETEQGIEKNQMEKLNRCVNCEAYLPVHR